MFSDRILTLAGLCRIDLPDRTLRLCDGGQVIWGAETYRNKDAVFGTIGAIESFDEDAGDEAPDSKMTFLPASGAAAATLSHPTYQMSRIRFWLAQVDPTTGATSDASVELLADLLLDTTELVSGERIRALEMGMISAADLLFSINEGNVLASRFHKKVYPGELGFDNAVDVGVTVAWRVKSPPRGSVVGGGGGFGNDPKTTHPGFEVERA
jgi:hypothetical protein